MAASPNNYTCDKCREETGSQDGLNHFDSGELGIPGPTDFDGMALCEACTTDAYRASERAGSTDVVFVARHKVWSACMADQPVELTKEETAALWLSILNTEVERLQLREAAKA